MRPQICTVYGLTLSTHKMLILTHMHRSHQYLCHLFTPALDYECRHENKGTDLVLVLEKYWVCKWDHKSCEICTVYRLTLSEYTQNAHPHTHRSHQYLYHLFTPTLDYECRHENKDTDLVLVLEKCWVCKWDRKSCEICTVYRLTLSTHKMFIDPHTHIEVTNM
jgi:hypothetical protein